MAWHIGLWEKKKNSKDILLRKPSIRSTSSPCFLPQSWCRDDHHRKPMTRWTLDSMLERERERYIWISVLIFCAILIVHATYAYVACIVNQNSSLTAPAPMRDPGVCARDRGFTLRRQVAFTPTFVIVASPHKVWGTQWFACGPAARPVGRRPSIIEVQMRSTRVSISYFNGAATCKIDFLISILQNHRELWHVSHGSVLGFVRLQEHEPLRY